MRKYADKMIRKEEKNTREESLGWGIEMFYQMFKKVGGFEIMLNCISNVNEKYFLIRNFVKK